MIAFSDIKPNYPGRSAHVSPFSSDAENQVDQN